MMPRSTSTLTPMRMSVERRPAAKEGLAALMRLLEFTDSAFPVGTFAFSNTLETAAVQGVVTDAASLGRYVEDVVRQAAFTDGITALHAFRSRLAGDYRGILEADRQTILCKMNEEARLMTRRMGRKLAELSCRIVPDEILSRWLCDIVAERTPGTYPVAQGVLFAAGEIAEEGLFCSLLYGAANMVAGAALRCVRVSHYDTQRILYRVGGLADALYEEVRGMGFDDICSFVPQMDILASLHEKGVQRMFMN